ncbi:MAG: PKD domain-containing protein [bacterium]
MKLQRNSVVMTLGLLCASNIYAQSFDIMETQVDYCGPEHGNHDIGCLGLSFGYRTNVDLDEYGPGGTPGADGTPDILQYMREFNLTVPLPAAAPGYKWEATGDTTFTLIMGGDLDSDPQPIVDVAPDGHYDPEWFDVTVEGDYFGRVLDKIPDNDPFHMNSGKDWGCLWNLNAGFCDRVYDNLNPPESPTLPSIHGSTTVSAEQMNKFIADGKIELNFKLAADHNDLTGHLPYYTNDEEFVTARFQFNAEQVLDAEQFTGTPPTVSLVASTVAGPGPLDVAFNATGSTDPDNDIVSYDWDFGDGDTDSGDLTAHTFTAPGVYTVTLTVTDAGNNVITKTVEITVNENEIPQPVIAFAPSITEEPLAVDFSAINSIDPDGEIATYEWDFGDGNTSTDPDATHLYELAGDYPVTLTVTDLEGAQASATVIVSVSETDVPGTGEPPIPLMAILDLELPPLRTGTFDATTSDGDIVDYQWNFGDGSTDTGSTVNHTYAAAGTYTVVLRVTTSGGKTAAISQNVVIENIAPLAAISATPLSGVIPVTVAFDSSASVDTDGSIASYSWDFGDGTTSDEANPQHSYSTAGTYPVSLVITDNEGATSTANTQITASPLPPVELTSTLIPTDDIGASNDGANPTLKTSKWDHSYLRFLLNELVGEVSSATLRVYLDTTDSLETSIWEAGSDDWTEETGAPEKVGGAGGTLIDTVTQAGPGYIDVDVTAFVAAQQIGDGVASFELGNTAGGWKNLSSKEGSNTPQLIVVTQQEVLSNEAPLPVIDISPDGQIEPPADITFDASASTDPDGTIESYLWDFGNGDTATTVTASRTFTEAGTYLVQLTVADNHGTQSTTARSVVVAPLAPNVPPTALATATPDSGVAPLPVQFSGLGSSDTDGTLTLYSWDFGDGSFGVGTEPQHTYAAAGNYTAQLTVTDDRGDTATHSVNISVAEPPNVAPTAAITATPVTGAAPLLVTFSSASTDSDGSIVSYAWDFGDGSSSTDAAPQHEYAAIGSYTVSLTVTDDEGASGNSTTTITATEVPNIPPTAQASASAQSVEIGTPIQFSSTGSVDSDGSIASYSWDFGDGNSSSEANPEHLYSAVGDYTVTLTVTDNVGDSAQTTLSVSITEIPNVAPVASASASVTSGDAPLTVQFDASASSDSDGTIASYSWTFGDGGSATGATPEYTYNLAGVFTATVTITDDDGATSTASVEITATEVPVPGGEFSLLPTDDIGANGAPSSPSLPMNAWTHAFTRFDLSEVTGESVESAVLRIYTGEDVAMETTAWIAGSDDWSETTGAPDKVGHSWLGGTELETVAHSTAGYVEFTVTDFVAEQLAGDGIASFEFSNNQSGWKDYDSREGVNPPQLVVTTTSSGGGTPNQAPVAAMTLSATSGTAPLEVSFDGTGSSDADGSISSYEWDFGDGSTANGSTALHTYTSDGTFTAILRVTDNLGLQNITTQDVTVAPASGNQDPVATATATPDTVEVNETVQFDASGSSDADGSIASYSWDFGDGNSASGVNPQHAYASAGTYTVELTVTDNEGATNVSDIEVVVTPAAGPGGTTTLEPTDDIGASGDATSSYLNANAWSHAFVRFNAQGIDGNVTQATLRVYTADTSGLNTTIWAAGTDEWNEATGAPAKVGHSWLGGIVIADLAHTEAGYVDFDVTSFVAEQVAGDGIVSFEMSNDASGWKKYESRQGAHSPQLVIETSGGGASAPSDPEPTPVTPPTTGAVIGMSSDTVLAGEAITVDAADSITGDATITGYSWAFGDGSSGTTSPISHTYSLPGTYSITLTLQLSDGGELTAIRTFEVLDAANASGPFTYQTFVTGLHNLYANTDWHDLDWWGNEGFNPLEIPVVGGEAVSVKYLDGKIDFDYTGTLGIRSVYFDADGSHSNGLANNGVRWYALTGLWVSQISYDEPYWSFTPIGSEFEVGKDFSAVAPANAVALLLASTDPNYVVDQAEIDRVSYFTQDLLGHVDNSGKWDLEITSTAPPTAYPPFDYGDALTWDEVQAMMNAAESGGTTP